MSNMHPPSPIRRRPLACTRCRRRKVRCDGASPACTNCAKAGVECLEGAGASAVSRSRLQYLENRVRELEEYTQTVADSSHRSPDFLGVHSQHPSLIEEDSFQYPPCPPPESNPPQSCHARDYAPVPASAAEPSPTDSATSRITRDQPLAHEVGLLSLSNASDPKYLGPSSGVTLARLIYENAPQSQGRSLASLRQYERQPELAPRGNITADAQPSGLPSMAHCQQYAEAYFEATPFYPFISQEDFYALLGRVSQFNDMSVWDHRLPVDLACAQVFLVLSIGAQFLETRLSTDYSSRGLFVSGMRYCGQVNLHDTIEGTQILLLLVLHSFHSPDGLNAWYLLHTIVASCLDLGLQRRDLGNRDTETAEHRKTRHMRSAIFWSAYSMDRTLTTILGRPLTLRDEAIDRDFPGMDVSGEVDDGATQWSQHVHVANREMNASALATLPYTACIYSLRFDRIVAETKLMLYRVSRSPSRFPWPNDVAAWQLDTQSACTALFNEVQSLKRGNPLAGVWPLPGVVMQNLELKYHQCMLLLFRPSPQITHPSAEAVRHCFTSATEMIRVYSDLHRFSNMECSWLSAHSIFVAAITMLYCLWANPAMREPFPRTTVLERADQALQLLSFLGKTWSVAYEARQKLSKLVAFTTETNEPGMGVNQHQGMRHDASTGSLNIDPCLDKGSTSQDRTGINMVGQEGANILIDELGILRDLFDLGWLNDIGVGSPPNTWQ